MEENRNTEDIRNRIVKSESLSFIQRVPTKTSLAFKKFANEDFAGDYGMALKHLLDFYFGVVPTGWEHLEIEIDLVKKSVEELKRTLRKDEKEEKGKKALDGGRIE